MKTIKCTNCKRKIPSDSLLCPYCGERLKEAITPPSLNLPPPINPNHGIVRKRIKVIIPIAVIVMILIIVVFIIFIIKAQNMLDCQTLFAGISYDGISSTDGNFLVKGHVFTREEYCVFYYAEIRFISLDENGNELDSYYLKLDNINVQKDKEFKYSYLIEDPNPLTTLISVEVIDALGKSNR